VLLQINGQETYYTVEGRGQPVVVLHGWGTSSQVMSPLCGSLTDSFRVLAVDLPGFGWSPRPPNAWGTGDYAVHIERLMRETGIEVAALVGHSFGGRVAIQLAAQQPALVSRLALVASAGIRPPRRAGYRVRVTAFKLARWVLSLPVWGSTGQRVRSRLSDRFGSRDYRAAGAMRPTLVKVVNEDLAPLLPAVQAPTLLLWGDQDQEVPRSAMEIMAGQIPQARFIVLEGAGHFPFLDAPEKFGRILKEFLQAGGL